MYFVELNLFIADAVEFLDVLKVVVSSGELASKKEGDRWFDQEDRPKYHDHT